MTNIADEVKELMDALMGGVNPVVKLQDEILTSLGDEYVVTRAGTKVFAATPAPVNGGVNIYTPPTLVGPEGGPARTNISHDEARAIRKVLKNALKAADEGGYSDRQGAGE